MSVYIYINHTSASAFSLVAYYFSRLSHLSFRTPRVDKTVNKMPENGFDIHFSVKCLQFKKVAYIFCVCV